MKDKFVDYLKNLGVSEIVRNRIETVHNEIKSLYKIEIEDIFICDIVSSDGTKDYTSLWLFNKNAIIECKNVMIVGKEDYDLVVLDKNIAYFSLQKDNYDINAEPTAVSRLNVRVAMRNQLAICQLVSTSVNCKYLLDIAKRYLINNTAAV